MYVKTTGDTSGRPVLLLHGGGVGGWMWNPTVALLPQSYHMIVPDLPGHDHSNDAHYVSHEQTCRELVTVVESVANHPVIVVGFSLGAQLAVLLASQYPHLVEGIVVVSAQATPTPAPGLTLGLLSLFAPLAKQHWFARLQAKELFIPPALLDDYLRTSAHISRETLITSVRENIQFVAPPGWGSFPRPALVLVGETERGFMKDSARTLHHTLTTSELEIVPKCGHGIPLQQPEWFAERLLGWFPPEQHRTHQTGGA